MIFIPVKNLKQIKIKCLKNVNIIIEQVICRKKVYVYCEMEVIF